MKKLYLIMYCLIIATSVFPQNTSVLTHRYGDRRLGWNDNETILNPENVNADEFGWVFSRSVDDEVYAQPLIVSGLLINDVKQNVVFVATLNNSVYAFNADDPSASASLWHVSLNTSGARVFGNSDLPCSNFDNHIGIVGTPVIDTNTMTMYVLSHDVSMESGKSQQYLHAIDIRTGEEKPGSPVAIMATYPGSGVGSIDDTVYFDQDRHNQRTALLLHDGVVYACWASHCDHQPYHGWVIGFDANTLQNKYVYNNTPMDSAGGIWMAGNAPSVDDNGYIYIISGNGNVGYNGDPNDPLGRGESLLKFFPTGDSLKLVDFFTPNNYDVLEQNDLDYGIGGAMLIPNSSLSVSNSKEGKIFLLDDDYLGKYTPGNDSLLQAITVVPQTGPHNWYNFGTPVYYHYANEVDTECVYVWAPKDMLTQLFLDRTTDRFDTTRTIKGTTATLNSFSNYGPVLSVSSNGTSLGTGIVWALHSKPGGGNSAVLEAYDAKDVRKLLWSSDMGPTTNRVETLAKFNTPVIANGKVYIPTFSNKLEVFGLLPEMPTGIHSESSVLKIAGLYPNPAGKEITIRYFVNESANKLSAQVVDMYGRKLLDIPLNANPGEHSQFVTLGGGFVTGLYSVIFYADGSITYTSRFIIDLSPL
jgi:hypothetical protein